MPPQIVATDNAEATGAIDCICLAVYAAPSKSSGDNPNKAAISVLGKAGAPHLLKAWPTMRPIPNPRFDLKLKISETQLTPSVACAEAGSRIAQASGITRNAARIIDSVRPANAKATAA